MDVSQIDFRFDVDAAVLACTGPGGVEACSAACRVTDAPMIKEQGVCPTCSVIQGHRPVQAGIGPYLVNGGETGVGSDSDEDETGWARSSAGNMEQTLWRHPACGHVACGPCWYRSSHSTVRVETAPCHAGLQ